MNNWQQWIEEDDAYDAWADQIEQENRRWIEEYDRGDSKMDMTQYATTESNDLKAADFVGKNLRLKISDVTTRTYPAKGDKPEETKGVLSFEGKEKTVVLSKTNTKILINAYGADSEGWKGHEIGLSTHDYDIGIGWVVKPLDVAEPEFQDDVHF